MKHLFPLLLLLAIVTGFSSCRRDEILTDASAKLEFSKDTIFFDTVFTTIGSSTRFFKVFNRNNESIKISNIRLAGGSSSQFRLNIDGVASWQAQDIEIRKRDSMFVFVEVTVDPNNSNSPLLVSDSVLFETNGNHQKVLLEAVGQDVYLHYPTNITSDGLAYSFIDCRNAWVNDKPHLIYGMAIIPAGQTLVMMPGTRVNLHQSAILAADSGATLQIKGQLGHEVDIQGDRLEDDYKEEPGQWGFIWLSSKSIDNTIDWAIIKNGSAGVVVDTVVNANPTLRITNTKIRNMTLYGIFGRGGHVVGANVLVCNCGEYCFAGAYGGSYSFRHCTFANYWNAGNRDKPVVALNNWYKDINENIQRRDLDSAHFYNCVVYGALDNELSLDSNTTGGFNFRYRFDHTLLKTNLNTSDINHFNTCSINGDPAFHDIEHLDFRPDSWSAMRGLADFNIAQHYPIELQGRNRLADGFPDAGAFEFQ